MTRRPGVLCAQSRCYSWQALRGASFLVPYLARYLFLKPIQDFKCSTQHSWVYQGRLQHHLVLYYTCWRRLIFMRVAKWTRSCPAWSFHAASLCYAHAVFLARSIPLRIWSSGQLDECASTDTIQCLFCHPHMHVDAGLGMQGKRKDRPVSAGAGLIQ